MNFMRTSLQALITKNVNLVVEIGRAGPCSPRVIIEHDIYTGLGHSRRPPSQTESKPGDSNNDFKNGTSEVASNCIHPGLEPFVTIVISDVVPTQTLAMSAAKC